MSILRSIFSYQDPTDLGKSPSFNDFSLHVGQAVTEAETADDSVEECLTPTTSMVQEQYQQEAEQQQQELPKLVSAQSEPISKKFPLIDFGRANSDSIGKDVWVQLSQGKSSSMRQLRHEFHDIPVSDPKKSSNNV
eukprot:TRINITY_DN427_c1_g1_i13.p1 TRINITY_DN427_c1_g1~~TRINITY_DN427_c1_g1_i13.p1  ORF type:complete len:136 (+),score=25.18 TRINITY_DN427_c1_g1_i13:462-869(+)